MRRHKTLPQSKDKQLTPAITIAQAGSACDSEIVFHSGGPNAYAEVASAVWRYYDGVAEADEAMLVEVLDPIWNGKRMRASDETLAVEEKDDFVARILEQGPTPTLSDKCHLTSVQVYFDDFAIARTDDWERAAATIFTLFKARGVWRIVGEASSGAEYGTRQARFNPQTAEVEVLSVLAIYYRAVEEGDPDALRRIFDPGWHMKNHEGETLVSENKATFVARAESGPFEGYVNDRQIADVQIVFDRMAYVRIDKPSRSVVTVFIFFRLGDEWVVVDKAFSSLHK